ncbi:MAG: helix-turn-helix domain-containing protein, partial [Proteobacteria bacterium]|nr:helix-turn-helix domain-containing protein [Pseudomonadota bacterium]
NSSGNVFTDLGFDKEEAANLLIRSELIIELSDLIKKSGLKQNEMAKLLGVKQPDISAIMKRKIEKFTIDRLVNFLTCLNQEVMVKTKPRRRKNNQNIAERYAIGQ